MTMRRRAELTRALGFRVKKVEESWVGGLARAKGLRDDKVGRAEWTRA